MNASPTIGMDARTAAYRDAEDALYRAHGVDLDRVRDHRLTLPGLGAEVRVREVGEGRPVLLVHGILTSGATWAPLVGRLDGFRVLVLDRPGTGLSAPLPTPLGMAGVAAFATAFAVEVLDALGVGRADLIASSFGGMLALRAAAAHPDRFDRMVQMACPAFVPGMATPSFMRVMLNPVLRRLIAALPPNQRSAESIMRQMGHAASLDAGRFDQVFWGWNAALNRHTDTMRHDGATIGSAGSMVRGFSPAWTIPAELLAAVRTPTHFLWGGADTFGGPDVAHATVDAMPAATLEVWDDAGHLPWLDGPDRAANVCTTFLQA